MPTLFATQAGSTEKGTWSPGCIIFSDVTHTLVTQAPADSPFNSCSKPQSVPPSPSECYREKHTAGCLLVLPCGAVRERFPSPVTIGTLRHLMHLPFSSTCPTASPPSGIGGRAISIATVTTKARTSGGYKCNWGPTWVASCCEDGGSEELRVSCSCSKRFLRTDMTKRTIIAYSLGF